MLAASPIVTSHFSSSRPSNQRTTSMTSSTSASSASSSSRPSIASTNATIARSISPSILSTATPSSFLPSSLDPAPLNGKPKLPERRCSFIPTLPSSHKTPATFSISSAAISDDPFLSSTSTSGNTTPNYQTPPPFPSSGSESSVGIPSALEGTLLQRRKFSAGATDLPPFILPLEAQAIREEIIGLSAEAELMALSTNEDGAVLKTPGGVNTLSVPGGEKVFLSSKVRRPTPFPEKVEWLESEDDVGDGEEGEEEDEEEAGNISVDRAQ